MNQLGVLNQPNNEVLRRPMAITVICVIGFVGVGLTVPLVFSEMAKQIGAWFGPYAGFVAITNLICMIGLWRTKLWGLYTYIALVLVNQIVLIAKGEWHIVVLPVQVIIILIGLYHLHPEARAPYHRVALYLKRKAWAYIVAYMVGIHNPYRELEDDSETIVYTIKSDQIYEDSAPKD